jgi:hypothetical protein
MDVKFETQKAVFDTLQSNSAFMDYIGDRLYDTPVINSVYPYVCIESIRAETGNRHGKKGYILLLTLGVYTNPGTLGTYQRCTIQSMIDSTLNIKRLPIESGDYEMGGMYFLSSTDFNNSGILGSNLTYKIFMYADSLTALNLSGCVACWSLWKVYENYTGYAIRLRRGIDNEEMDIPFYGNYIHTQLARAFCGSSNGYVSKIYNQSPGGNDATQVSLSTQPKLVSAGSINTQGILFNGTSSSMSVTVYSGINILNNPMTIYASVSPLSSTTGFACALNTSAYTNTQYGMRISNNYVYGYIRNTTKIQGSINISDRFMFNWKGDGSVVFKTDTESLSGTCDPIPTPANYFNIGCWLDPTPKNFYNGYIKSLMIFNTDETNNYNTLAAY